MLYFPTYGYLWILMVMFKRCVKSTSTIHFLGYLGGHSLEVDKDDGGLHLTLEL